MPEIRAVRTEPYRFLPSGVDPEDLERIGAFFEQLEAREVSTREQLEELILDWDELSAFLSDCKVSAYIDMTSDTRNPEYDARYRRIVERVVPLVEERGFRLEHKVLDSPAAGLLGEEYTVFLRDLRAEVELYREENIPLLTEELKLVQEFEKIAGDQKAEFRGRSCTLAQLRRFFEEPDRDTREEAWRAHAEAQLADAAALDALFDRLFEVRQRIARNAGCVNYREYRFRKLKRFDYTPEDCFALHAAVERHVVPLVQEHQEQRKRQLGISRLRPWDLAVDPTGSPPPRPFESVERLQEGCARIFHRLDGELGDYFREMIESHLLDLENRPAKGPGGYMDVLADRRVPFIFMNAVGIKRDVETLLHEGGHAFNYYLARELPLSAYHMPPHEFAEVGSMAMELLARPYLGEFYAGEELDRLLDDQLRLRLSLFPRMALVDAFQHWLYTAPAPDAAARHAKWAQLDQRFHPGIDWSGLERYREIGWQFLHVFTQPFYYIEYAIALLASLRIWLRSLEEEREALEAYKRALALGGSRPLPELFRVAGAEFAFDESTVRSVMEATAEQLAAPRQSVA